MRRGGAVLLAGLLVGLHTLPASAADPVVRPVPATAALVTSGPPLRTPAAALAASLQCRGDVAGADLAPVVLLHGTGSTPQESWDLVFAEQLTGAGHPVCLVTLPDRATGDMQVSVEFVVHAVRVASQRRGGRVDVLGHSQGATLAVTALKLWPDLADRVEDYLGLAPSLQPGLTGEALCAMSCSAPFQQRREGSVFFTAVRAHPLPAGPSYTTIATRFDEIAAPAPQTSRLEGATNVVLQDRCPNKVTDHFGLLTDGTVVDLVLDGLGHAGPVDPARLPDTTCLKQVPDGTDPVALAPRAAASTAAALQAGGQAERLEAEPEVRCEVLATCADVDRRGRLLLDPAVGTSGSAPPVLRALVQAPGTLRLRVPDQPEVLLDVGVGPLEVPLPAGARAVEVATTTDYYRVPGVELSRVLATDPTDPAADPVSAPPAPGQAQPQARTALAATGPDGSTGVALLALLAVTAALVARRLPGR